MNKLTTSFLAIFITFISFSQEVKILPEMELNLSKLVSVNENQVLYRYKSKFDVFLNKFKVSDSKTGVSTDVTVADVKYKGADGIPVSFIVKDGALYELLLFKGSQTREATYNGLVKRDLKTLAQIGELLIIDRIEDSYYLAGQSAEIHLGEKGFYVVAGASHIKKHYLKKFTYDLKEEWSMDLDFLDVAGAAIRNISVAANDELLLAIIFSEKPKSTVFKFKYPAAQGATLIFLHVDSEGVSTAITPEFEASLNVRAYDFHYYAKEKVLVGLFSTTKVKSGNRNETEGIGYAYMAWDLDGALLKSKNHYLKAEDFEGPELTKRLAQIKLLYKNPIEPGKELPTISMYGFEVFFQPDGSVLVLHGTFSPVVYGNYQYGVNYNSANLLYKINTDGELDWIKFFARDNYFSLITPLHEHFQRGDNLHMFINMSAKEFTSDEAALQAEAKKFESAKSEFILERILNIKTGEIVSFKPVLKEPFEKYSEVIQYTEPDKVIFEFRNGKKMKIVYIER